MRLSPGGHPSWVGWGIMCRVVDDIDARTELRRNAGTLAAALRVTATVLAVPSVLVAAGALVGFAALAGVAGTALLDGATIARWILLGLAIAGLVVTAWFLWRVLVTWRASRDPEALANEIVGLVDIEAVTTAMLADLAEFSSREGGLRAVSRARALWRLLRRLDMNEHLSAFERAQWFVPPKLAGTWQLAQATTWGGLAAWVLVPVVTGARLAGWL